MGIYDRDYTHDRYRSIYSSGGGGMRIGFPKMTPVVKWLLIANIGIFFFQLLVPDTANLTVGEVSIKTDFLEKFFVCLPDARAFQLWRLISYQFLHGDPIHILFNMIGLFFLGPRLERHWGRNKFLTFYLGCGVAGGITYIILAQMGIVRMGPMLGASGAILGMLAACAILFPQFVVFFFFFPIPIRIAAIVLTLLYLANVISGGYNAGGDAAHLGGMAAGAAYVMSGPWRRKIKWKSFQKNQYKKKKETDELQNEVDRILEKVHNKGIQSLSRKEKKILRKATKKQNMRNR